MAIHKTEYLIITSDFDLAKKLKEILSESKGQPWKFYTKYLDEKGEMISRTSEESAGRK